MKSRRLIAAIGLVAVAASLTACGGTSASGSNGKTTVNWWTWDDKQAASYQKCVPGFEKANPDITVKISQYAWDDYWTKLTAGFAAGDAPDAFMDHVNYYPAYADQGVIVPLDDYIKKSNFDMSKFATGVSSWKYTDGKQYGIPKDWAAEGFYYNADMVKQAGITPQQLDTMTWNPDNGGTFEKIVAHLTVDDNGVRGDQPGFDKNHVKVYGIANVGSEGLNGQDTWASFLSTTGWKLGNKANWPTKLNYDDPLFKKSISQIRDLITKGYAPKQGAFTSGATDILGSGKAAMVSSGSWYAPTFFSLPGIKVGLAPTVANDQGKRSSITNSNADSITASSPHKDQAWKWVSYMGSVQCQSVAGADGTFFPSIPQAMQVTSKDMLAKGIDLSVFTDQEKAGTLFTTPTFKNGTDLDTTLSPMIDSFFTFDNGVSIFDKIASESSQILAKK